MRRQYGSTASWLLHLHNSLVRRLPRVRLLGYGAIAPVRVHGSPGRLLLRQGTSDWHVMLDIFVKQQYQPVLELLPSPTRCIVDLGANVGLSVRYWQIHCPEAHVIAVEPDAANMDLCRKNLLDPSRATLFQACAAAQCGQVALVRTGEPWEYHMQPAGADSVNSVTAVAMPQILQHLPDDSDVDLLKCDIEGAEAEIFADCSAWIHRVRTLLIETHLPYTLDRLQSDISRQLGRDVRRVLDRDVGQGNAIGMFLLG